MHFENFYSCFVRKTTILKVEIHILGAKCVFRKFRCLFHL